LEESVKPESIYSKDLMTALITGAASGIGAGIARRFADAGYALSLFDINASGLERIAAELRPAMTLPVRGDVNEPADAERAINKTVEAFGSLDVLVNNAGIEIAGTAVSLPLADWDRLLGVNLRGPFLFSKFAVPRMKPGSAIVNIASVHAFAGYPDCAAYDASKAGLLGLTRALALDHAPAGIRVNAVCPGYIQTPLLDKWLETVPDRQAALSDVLKAHPLGRIGLPQDVAEAVLFLASPRASFISGASLVVDGAMTVSGK
jgi:NAD(P)-dependent dehydrogenase (short-subunit alcohol dehydrogenase family)